ncbi:MAG: hypothetical protein ACJATI_000034 [Halioglobus sp.]|jgi:hypothetical protein
MKQLFISVITISVLFSSSKTLGKLGIKPSILETVMSLKSILDSSTSNTIKKLKDINDRGTEGSFPSKVGAVLKTLKTVGYRDEIEKVTKSIGQATTLILAESEEIVNDAISELRFIDAVAMVLGREDVATNVLKHAMYSTVKKRYSTRLGQELNKPEVNTYWPLAARAYNIFAKTKWTDLYLIS